MATYRVLLENVISEQGMAEVDADSPQAALAQMQWQIENGSYDASWNHVETILCRILEIEDEAGNCFSLEEESGAETEGSGITIAARA